jgi:hypothetical protein
VDHLVATAREALNYDRTEEARAAAEEALSLLPGHPPALRLLDELASPREGESSHADVARDEETDPLLPNASSPMGAPRFDVLPGAIPDGAPGAVPTDVRQVESLTSAALRHFVGNDHGKARQAVERALALDPGNRRALELLKILGALG